MGVFEIDKFAKGSKAIAEAIVKATKNGAFSLIGGGESVACINKFGMADQVATSPPAAALLEYMEGIRLPACRDPQVTRRTFSAKGRYKRICLLPAGYGYAQMKKA